MKVIDHPTREGERVIVVAKGDNWGEFHRLMCIEGNTFPFQGEGTCVHYQFPCHDSPSTSLVRVMDEGWFNFYMAKKNRLAAHEGGVETAAAGDEHL